MSSRRTGAARWIDALGLAPHPEGGYFRETYRSGESLSGTSLPERYGGASRSLSTSIYYLLERGDRSRLHRLASDEIWNFHAGDPVTLHLLDEEEGYRVRVLGLAVERGQSLQVAVPRGVWFGATLEHSDLDGAAGYALVGCAMAPGFEFADFELAEADRIMAAFPDAPEVVGKLL